MQNARHGNLTPPRIAPSCPQAGVSLCTDEVIAKQLVLLFCGRMGTARRLIWPSLMQKSAQAGLGASSKVALRWLGAPSGNVFQSPDVTGLARCFSRCEEKQSRCPSDSHWGLFSHLTTKNLSLRKIFSLRLCTACWEIPTSAANSLSVFLSGARYSE